MASELSSERTSSSFFTVNNLPHHERYDIWRGSIDVLCGVEAEKTIRDNNFKAEIESHLLGSLMLMEVTSLAQQWRRTPQQIARNDMDHYCVSIFKEGDLICEHSKGGNQLKKGGVVVFDLTQEFATKTSDLKVTTLIIPRPLIEDLVNHPDDHNMRFLDPKYPMTRIVHDNLLSLQRNMPNLYLGQAATIEKTLAMLVANCLNTAKGETSTTIHQRQNVMNMVKMRRYIREQLASPDLTPRKVARDLGVSRSKLYDYFASYGGVYQYIRNMRLRRAVSLLTDPMHKHSSIYDISLECGFSSDASFIRAFKERYELTPGDVRNGLSKQEHASLGDPYQIDTRYEDWLQNLMV
ncbi:helix-turn-helix domain-containing protein [Thalassospira australica]|uniref:helix-turn-helix domain-containing protein n=1 Tax=Thalassospira australica TaxID=1528106 RepID=UPI000689B668|nr:helix-turn-helix domain-containing protein [Thalassospira australica]